MVVMRGRLHAALVMALLSSVPVLNMLGGAALALVTLRKGPGEGMGILLLAAGITGIAFWLLIDSAFPLLALAVMVWLPLWLLATVLRYSVSWARTLQLGAVLTMLGMLAYAAYLGDPTAWGRTVLGDLIGPFLRETGMVNDGEVIEQALDYLAPYTLGLLFGNNLVSLLASLLLGRWWQATLYNPGGFREEFHQLRLGPRASFAATVIFGAALLSGLPVLINMALPVLVVYVLQGISVVHGVVGKAGIAWGWLSIMYGLLLLALPQMLLLLCLVGVSDPWLDSRARIKPRPGQR